MCLTLPQTKTHQHYDQMHSVVLPHIHNFVLCPVTAITEIFERIPALSSDIAFGYWELGRYVPLVVHRVKQMLDVLGNITRPCKNLHFMLFVVVVLLSFN